MTFKQWMRRLFADLWHRCADLGVAQIRNCSANNTPSAEWWESFVERCDKRAIKHAEYVPGKDHGDNAVEQPKEK